MLYQAAIHRITFCMYIEVDVYYIHNILFTYLCDVRVYKLKITI